MATDRTPRPFECVCRGKTISGTVHNAGWNLRDYWVQFWLDNEQYSFTLIMSGLGTVPRHSVNYFVAADDANKRHFLSVPTQTTEQAFEDAINIIVEWHEQHHKRDS